MAFQLNKKNISNDRRPHDFRLWGLLSIIIISVVYLLLNFNGISYYYFDEYHYVNASDVLLSSNKVLNWEHPPLGKYIIKFGRSIFDNKVYGSRFFGVLLFPVIIILLGGIGNLIRENKDKSKLLFFLPGFFAATDPFLINMSKIAMLDIYALFFQVLLIYFVIIFLKNTDKNKLLSIAIVSALGLSCKWSLIPFVFTSFVFISIRVFKTKIPIKHLVFSIIIFVVVYFLTFIPYLLVHNSETSIFNIFKLQLEMFNYHSSFTGNPYHSSAWWSWPILLKPIWLKFEQISGSFKGIFTISNPVVNFIFLISIPYFLLNWKRIKKEEMFLIICYLNLILIWAFSSRETQFYHYYLSSLPMIYLISSIQLNKVSEKKAIFNGALLFSIIFFVLCLPFVYNWEVDQKLFDYLVPFSNWKYILN